MLREMIRQHYNHPSVIVWGSMNEVLLWSKDSERIQVQTDTAYVNGVRKFAVQLDSTVRAEDATRYSTMAMHMSDDYEKYGFAALPAVSGWNSYNGWYSGEVVEFSKLLDEKHRLYPHEVLLISEYGAESDKQLNTENPLRLDFSGQYQRYYHESYLAQMKKMPYLAGTAIWNEFDFSQPNVGGTISHMNHKGMATWNREPKDVYYLYKSNWNPEPMVYIATRYWLQRGGKSGALSTVDVYANTGEVTLTVNGKSYGVHKPDAVNKLSWKVTFQEGDNVVLASSVRDGKTYTDRVIVNYSVFDDKIDETFSSLAVNVGADAQYIDDARQIWIEDRPYKKGGYGYIGGSNAMLNIKTLITHTNDTPLFYSYRDDIKGYRFDVPDGRYELELCFIEPEKTGKDERLFNVSVNGYHFLTHIDLVAEYGQGVAVKKKVIAEAKNGQGVFVELDKVKGNPVLSGIRLVRLN